MQVTVRLFAVLRQRAGRSSVAVTLPDGATVADALGALADVAADVPCVLAVNRRYADGAVVLVEGDELALIPPVSGGAGATHVRLTEAPLSLDAVATAVRDPRAGGHVLFAGTTRDLGWLDYEAYGPMALERMEAIAEEAVERHGLCAAAIEHRTGRVALGEASVLVAASAPHRAEAFAGARELIDRVKAEAPVWKAEEGDWVAGTVPEVPRP